MARTLAQQLDCPLDGISGFALMASAGTPRGIGVAARPLLDRADRRAAVSRGRLPSG